MGHLGFVYGEGRLGLHDFRMVKLLFFLFCCFLSVTCSMLYLAVYMFPIGHHGAGNFMAASCVRQLWSTSHLQEGGELIGRMHLATFHVYHEFFYSV